MTKIFIGKSLELQTRDFEMSGFDYSLLRWYLQHKKIFQGFLATMAFSLYVAVNVCILNLIIYTVYFSLVAVFMFCFALSLINLKLVYAFTKRADYAIGVSRTNYLTGFIAIEFMTEYSPGVLLSAFIGYALISVIAYAYYRRHGLDSLRTILSEVNVSI